MEFKHPKYYKELRTRKGSRKNLAAATTPTSVLDPSFKLQAPSLKQAIQETVPWNEVLEATSSEAPSSKLQAQSDKLQASSRKLQAP